MKRLQSLTNFKSAKLEKKYLSMIHGGASKPTEGGEFCSEAGGSESDCTGYTSDVSYDDGSPTLYQGIFDISDKLCED